MRKMERERGQGERMKDGQTETHRGTEVGRRRKAGKGVAQDYFGKLKSKLINLQIETAQFVEKLERTSARRY